MNLRKVDVYINGEKKKILFIRVSRGHGALISSAFFQLESDDYNIGDIIYIDVSMGGPPIRLFYGIIRGKTFTNKDGIYEFNAFGVLSRAKDNFIASSTPDTSYKIFNKSIEILIGDLLNMSHIYNYIYDPTNFYLAVTHEYEINLINAYDMINQAKKIIAWEVWDDEYGNVYLKDRKPYIMSSDSSYKTIRDIMDFSYTETDQDLRNRVVIYGDNVYAEAKASSPYLPSGFYKTVVLASNLIQSQMWADQAAQYNLDFLNRLRYELSITIDLYHYVEPFKVITLNTGNSYIDGDWYVYNSDIEIRLNSGALQVLSLRR